MARAKKRVLSNIKIEAAQEASQQYAANANRLARIEVIMNEKIDRIKNEYQEEITELTKEQEDHMEVLRVYATEQQPNWGKKKSLEFLHTVIGFRTGTPKVTKDKKFTWEGITDLAKKFFPSYVRTKEELDKEAVIALSKDAAEFKAFKDHCYVDVVQEETFYVEPKKELVSEAA